MAMKVQARQYVYYENPDDITVLSNIDGTLLIQAKNLDFVIEIMAWGSKSERIEKTNRFMDKVAEAVAVWKSR